MSKVATSSLLSSNHIRHDKYNSKCVCEVCTCGNHRCPRGQSQRPKFQGTTTNQAFFDIKPLEKRQTFETPKPTASHYEDGVLQSSYKSQYQGLPAIKNPNDEMAQSAQLKVGKKAPFYGQTSYKSTYQPFQVKAPTYPKAQYKREPTKFEGSSSYQSDFQLKTRQLSSSDKFTPITNMEINRRRVPFEGQSAYKEQYQKPPMEENRSRFDFPKQQRETAKFEGSSTYKQHFVKPENPASPLCPVLQMPPVPRQPSPGKQHVNYSAQKNEWQ